MNEPPLFPHGEFVAPGDYDASTRQSLIDGIDSLPTEMLGETNGLSEKQLNTKYCNWTVRQIVHHVADSHINCCVRFKWSLTEETPTIKSYNESLWSEVIDATASPVNSSLTILTGIHARWGQLLRRMKDEDFAKGFFHPEMERIVTLKEALPSYVWHGQHHLAQIKWVKANRVSAIKKPAIKN